VVSLFAELGLDRLERLLCPFIDRPNRCLTLELGDHVGRLLERPVSTSRGF
jgi:hypothetical protein